MYGCESCTIKKAEHWRNDAFELWCWRRLLRVPWTATRSNQSILKEINLEYSLEGLMLKMKFQSFGYLMWRASSLEKTLMVGKLRAGGESDDRGWDGLVHHWLNGRQFEQAPGDGEAQGNPGCCSPWVANRQTWLSKWTTKLGGYLILTAHNPFIPKNKNSGRNLILFPAALER